MKKRISILIVVLTALVISICFISSQISNVAADKGGGPPFMDYNNPPPAPHDQNYWDFDNGTIVAWKETSPYSSRDKIYNITSMRLFTASENVSGNFPGQQPYDVYGVALTPMMWNASIEDLQLIPNFAPSQMVNVSLINYTNQGPFSIESNLNMLPCNFGNYEGLGPILNLFIPKNSSDVLDIDWCADALHWTYSMYIKGGPITQPEDLVAKSVTANSIHYWDIISGYYCDLYYSSDGILNTGEIYFDMGGEPGTINLTRIYDYNPLNDTKWSVEVGDLLYYGMERHEIRFNVTMIINMTVIVEFEEPISYQEVWANISMWNITTYLWEDIDTNGGNSIAIGRANDNTPFVIGDFGPALPLLLPLGFKISDFANIYQMIGEHDGTFNKVTPGDNYISLLNTTTLGSGRFQYNISGILELYNTRKLAVLFEEEDYVLYLKNSTVIDDSKIWTIDFNALDSKAFNITLNISVIEDAHLLYSAMSVNPITDVTKSLSYGVLFIDIWLNLTDDKLDQTHFKPINITIEFDSTKFKNMELYYFNTSSTDPDEWWQKIEFTTLADGKIMFTVNHTSIFAFTNVKYAIPLLLGDDDDDDEEGAPAIPIGNYYLIFIAIAIIGLVIHKKIELFKKQT
ncbi:MAG: hypothetical protein ACFFAT_22180 [Promethearchaeota archaeon]